MYTKKILEVVGFCKLIFFETQDGLEFVYKLMIGGGDGEVIYVNTEYDFATIR